MFKKTTSFKFQSDKKGNIVVISPYIPYIAHNFSKLRSNYSFSLSPEAETERQTKPTSASVMDIDNTSGRKLNKSYSENGNLRIYH